MDTVKNIDYKGYKINIYSDKNAQDPREWGNNNVMVCFHSRYNLGDKHDFSNPEDFTEWAEEQGDKIIALPLFVYEHSGITMSTGGYGCQWDSGQVGWIYTDIEILQKMGHKWKKWTKKRREDVTQWMEEDVKVYASYLEGDVYGFMIGVPQGEDEYDEEGGCWGFFGYNEWEKNGLLSEAQGEIDWMIKDAEEKAKKNRQTHYDQLKTWVKSKVQFEYRKPLTLAI